MQVHPAARLAALQKLSQQDLLPFLPQRVELPELELKKSEHACMNNCKEDVKITMRAWVLDVTPDGE